MKKIIISSAVDKNGILKVEKANQNIKVDLKKVKTIKCDALKVGDKFSINDISFLVVDDKSIKNHKYENICTSHVTNMEWLYGVKSKKLHNKIKHIPMINTWDVSHVNTMLAMFAGAKSFNQPLNNWNVSNVTDMQNMFREASSFNQPLNNWNVSNVKHCGWFGKNSALSEYYYPKFTKCNP